MTHKEDLTNIIEGRILAEKRKHPTLDWIKIASIKITNDIIDVEDLTEKQAKKEVFDVFDKYACIKNDKWYLELKKKELGEKH